MPDNTNSKNIVEDLANEIEDDLQEKNYLPSLFIGFLIFIAGIFILENFNQVFYFTQDDNLHEFLFPMIYGCKSLLLHGKIAEINPFQFGGIPLAGVSTYALSYPITYISFLFAKYILHNELWLMDVFCIFHLGVGYFLAYYAAKTSGVKNYLSVIYALFYVFSGYSLVAGRSWYNMMPCIGYAPIIIISANYLMKNKPDLKWIFLTGLPLGLLGIAGHAQMWVYTMMFLYLSFFLLFLLKKINFYKLFSLIYPTIICLTICIPQFYVTTKLISGIHRNFADGWEYVIQNLQTFIFPYYSINLHSFGTSASKVICFSGGLFTIIVLLSLILLLTKPDNLSKFFKNNYWLIIGIIAFCLALTNQSFIWEFFRKIPLFKQFRESIRFLIFVNLFLNLSGAILLSKMKFSANKAFKIFLILLMTVIFYRHLTLTKQAFYQYSIDSVFSSPSIETAIPDVKNYRIGFSGPFRSQYEDYRSLCNLNFATSYELYSVTGYDDQLSEILPDNFLYWNKNIKSYQAYGVKYLLVQRPYPSTNYIDSGYSREYSDFQETDYFKKIKSLDYVDIYEIKSPLPFAFTAQDQKSLPIKFNSQGAVVNLPEFKNITPIVVNMVYYPNYKAYLVQKETKTKKELLIQKNITGQIVVFVPADYKNATLVVRYESQWADGFIISCLLFIWGVMLYIFQKKITDNK